MRAHKSVAPVLTEIVALGCFPVDSEGQARHELRALLAVARAAKALRKRLEPYSDVDSLWEEDKKLVRSLSRLDALSKGRGR